MLREVTLETKQAAALAAFTPAGSEERAGMLELFRRRRATMAEEL